MIIHNNVLNCKTIEWADLKTYEFNNLKDSARDITKLQNAIVNNGFCFPFYLWASHRYVIDGNGRNLALQALENAGYTIPALPVVEIQAETLLQAKKLVLQASSQHGAITNQSYNFFVEDLDLSDEDFVCFNLDLPDLKIEDDYPDFNLDGFEEKPHVEKNVKKQTVTCPACDHTFETLM